MFSGLLRKYRYSAILLRELIVVDFKLRYQGSFLGYIWALLRPLFLFVILYLVFTRFIRLGDSVPYFPAYLMVGTTCWNFFGEATSSSVQAIVNNSALIRKISFPRYVIVLATLASALINLFFNLIILGFIIVISGAEVQVGQIPLAVLLFGELALMSMGFAFLLSALYVHLRDLDNIWTVTLQAGFYLTPILYPMTLMNETFQKLLILNPAAQIIQDLRHIFVTTQQPSIAEIYGGGLYRLIPLAFVGLVAALGAWYFRMQSPKFPEGA